MKFNFYIFILNTVKIGLNNKKCDSICLIELAKLLNPTPHLVYRYKTNFNKKNYKTNRK